MGKRKEFIGTVVSDRMKKTAIVKVTQVRKHPKYGRIMRQFSKFKVHDEKNEAKIGDQVKIQETRPLSKDKRYKLMAILKKAQLVEAELKE